MFHTKTMTRQDFPFATNLANTLGWKMIEEDFALMKYLEPDGCFVLYKDSIPIGIATTISYEGVGWFGNLVVKEEYRRIGAGRFLVNHAINYLLCRGIDVVGLFAYTYLTEFYNEIGFKTDEEFAVLNGENIWVSNSEKIISIQPENIDRIIRFDMACFGANRERLLRYILSCGECFGGYIEEDREVIGFVLAKVYSNMIEIGPLVCLPNREDVSLRLLNAVLNKFVNREFFLTIQKKQKNLINYLGTLGFQEEFSVNRMFLSKQKPKNCIYIAESLERG